MSTVLHSKFLCVSGTCRRIFDDEKKSSTRHSWIRLLNVGITIGDKDLMGAVEVVSKGVRSLAVLSGNITKIVRYLEDDTVP